MACSMASSLTTVSGVCNASIKRSGTPTLRAATSVQRRVPAFKVRSGSSPVCSQHQAKYLCGILARVGCRQSSRAEHQCFAALNFVVTHHSNSDTKSTPSHPTLLVGVNPCTITLRNKSQTKGTDGLGSLNRIPELLSIRSKFNIGPTLCTALDPTVNDRQVNP